MGLKERMMSEKPLVKLSVTSGLIGCFAMIAALELTKDMAQAAPPPGRGHDRNGPGDVGGDTGGGTPLTPLPELIELQGLVRDFRERSAAEGHPDFELQPNQGFGHYVGNIGPLLGDDNKPVYIGNGMKVLQQWRDNAGRPICYLLYDAARGDTVGAAPVAGNGAITTSESFSTWFNETPGVNLQKQLTLTLHLQPDNTYVFDDKEDPQYSSLGGFFPIEDEMFGNPGGSPDRNFHFTYELHTWFIYKEADDQHFRFVGDDDVWVYIDGKLVIDLGGVHPALEQYVDLNRLGLTDGQMYNLDFFFAERHRTQANFRIQTNIPLSSLTPQVVSGVYD